MESTQLHGWSVCTKVYLEVATDVLKTSELIHLDLFIYTLTLTMILSPTYMTLAHAKQVAMRENILTFLIRIEG